MIILAGLRHWLAVIVCMLMMILAACGSGKGDNYSVSSKSGKEASEAFRAVRSSKPMMYATQLAGFLYLAESLENVPDDLRARARRQDELASGLQRALNEALSSGAKFDPGEDDGH